LVLGADLGALDLVDRDTEASDPAVGVARELREPLDVAVRQVPVAFRPVRAELLAGAVVRGRPAPEAEASVPAARAAPDLARLVDAHAPPRRRERQRTGAAGDPAADDRNVDASVRRTARQRLQLFEPVGSAHRADATSPPDRPPLPRAPRRPARARTAPPPPRRRPGPSPGRA